MAEESQATTIKVPSELQISDKWDKCLERTIINVGTGLVVGGLLSFVLASKYTQQVARSRVGVSSKWFWSSI